MLHRAVIVAEYSLTRTSIWVSNILRRSGFLVSTVISTCSGAKTKARFQSRISGRCFRTIFFSISSCLNCDTSYSF